MVSDQAHLTGKTLVKIGEYNHSSVLFKPSIQHDLTYGSDFLLNLVLREGYTILLFFPSSNTFDITFHYRLFSTSAAPVLFLRFLRCSPSYFYSLPSQFLIARSNFALGRPIAQNFKLLATFSSMVTTDAHKHGGITGTSHTWKFCIPSTDKLRHKRLSFSGPIYVMHLRIFQCHAITQFVCAILPLPSPRALDHISFPFYASMGSSRSPSALE